jgi:hypothetical protein
MDRWYEDFAACPTVHWPNLHWVVTVAVLQPRWWFHNASRTVW